MASSLDRTGRAIRLAIWLAILVSLVPISVSASRKLRTFGKAELLLTDEGSGLRVRSVGESAQGTGLHAEDLLLTIDGREARLVKNPGGLFADRAAEVVVLREGRLVRLDSKPSPKPWDLRYLFLLVVGGIFLFSAGASLRQAGRGEGPAARLLFAAFAWLVGLVLILTPVPPVDRWFKLGVVLEDVARAFFPFLLLQLVFTFPRRSRRVPTLLFALPALALTAATLQLYFGAPGAAFDAREGVESLDRWEEIWMVASAVIATVRLVAVSRRRIDLLTEKQVRFLLLGTAAGLVPLCLLDLLPRALGGSLPILSTVSLAPLALLPIAFLASLTRYRLWDVEVFGRETASLLVTVIGGAGLFAIVEVFLSRRELADVPYAKGAIQSATGLLLALSFTPVKRGLSAAFAKLQYRHALADREALLGVVRELTAPMRRHELEELLVSRVTRGLGVTEAALLPLVGDGAIEADEVDGGPPLLVAELPEDATTSVTRLSRRTFDANPTPTVARLRRAGFRTLAPLGVSGRLLAFFAVSDRFGPMPLSVEDVELLTTVLAPAALALDHARLYDELEEQADRFKTLKEFHEDVVAGSAAAIVATDAEGRITSTNPAFRKLLGKSEEDLQGRLASEVLPEELRSPTSPTVPARLVHDFGTGPRTLDVAVSLFPGAPEGSAARVYVLHDATETARLERALADRERLAALGSLSAGMAHEVNTPLAGVAGFARLLLDETPEGDPRRSLVEKIEKQAFRASRLVGSLLDMARGRPREETPIDALALAADAVRAFGDEASARGVSLRTDLPPHVPRVVGHADALVQVLVNLLKNGAEAPGAKTVVLALHVSQDSVSFVVEDDGDGMTPDEAARVFEPFYSTKTARGGTGLGLAIARDIIGAHGGTLRVETEKGRGARFIVTLPIAS